jgi:uncharacterized protein YjbI with pentapeptide repeats
LRATEQQQGPGAPGCAGDQRGAAGCQQVTALLAGLIGVGALLTFWLNNRVYRLTQEGQITDRYTKAIEQLGSDKLDVRLGGIYALERIAKDSERDQPVVVEVLSAFVREASDPIRRFRASLRDDEKSEFAGECERSAALYFVASARLPTDVQAALTVLGRLPPVAGVSRGDLSGAVLPGAQLNKADLSGAQLNKADLSGAQLIRADLSDAQFGDADLSSTDLYGADLSGAYFGDANLSGARLGGANLSDANLNRADLSGAFFGDLIPNRMAQPWAPSWKLVGLTQAQLDSARGDAVTVLPDGLRRPDHWTAGEEPSPVSS